MVEPSLSHPVPAIRAVCASPSLLLDRGGRTIEALPLDDHTFLIDRGDSDTPTATFAGFDDKGRPAVVYDML